MPDFISSYIRIEQTQINAVHHWYPRKDVLSSQPFGIKHSPKAIKRH